MRPSVVRSASIAAAVALLAGCGKVATPDYPPGATYPKVYPRGAAGAAATASSTELHQPSANKSEFTADGAWIDPSMRRPTIDPRADLQAPGTNGNGSLEGSYGNTQ